MYNDAAAVENSSVVSQNVKHGFIICPSNSIPRNIPQRIGNGLRYSYHNVHSSGTHNSQDGDNPGAQQQISE